MPGKTQNIGLHRLYINGQHARCLCHINTENYTARAADRADRCHGLYSAQYIGCMGHYYEFCIWLDSPINIFGVDKAICSKAHISRLNSFVFREMVNRAQYRIVIQERCNDVIAGFQRALNRNIQRIRGIVCKHKPIGTARDSKKRRE